MTFVRRCLKPRPVHSEAREKSRLTILRRRMTKGVCSALGLDRVGISEKFIVINEHHGSDANFLINTVLSKSLEENRGIILVLFHNTFGHYHNIGMKLGYNLNSMRGHGVRLVEPMQYIIANIEDMKEESRASAENLAEHLFLLLREQYCELKKIRPSITIIIDDITHLINFNLGITEIWHYTRYLNTLKHEDPSLSLCVLTHSYPSATFDCIPNLVDSNLRRFAQLYIVVEPLSTGHSNDISGIMYISWRVPVIRKKYNWPETVTYHYKLLDRQINLFTPGGISA